MTSYGPNNLTANATNSSSIIKAATNTTAANIWTNATGQGQNATNGFWNFTCQGSRLLNNSDAKFKNLPYNSTIKF